MAKKITLKEYGDWLFDDNLSIIYEEKNLDENWLSDTALDVTQLAIGLGSTAASLLGVAPVGLALGGANVGISFARGDWLGVVLGLFPILDEVAPSFNILRRITDFLRNIPGGAQALETMENTTVAALRPLMSWIGAEGNAIVQGLNNLKNFVGQNTDRLIEVIRAGLGAVGASAEEISGVFRPIYDFLQSDAFRTVARLSEEGLEAGNLNNVLNGIRGAFGQVQNLIDEALRLVGQFGSADAQNLVRTAGEAATGAAGRKVIATAADTAGTANSFDTAYSSVINSTKPAPVVAENLVYRNHNTSNIIYTDMRFKRLAGIK